MVKHYSERNVPLVLSDSNGSAQKAIMEFVVADAIRPILAMGEVMRKRYEFIFKDGQGWLCRGDRWIPLRKSGSRFTPEVDGCDKRDMNKCAEIYPVGAVDDDWLGMERSTRTQRKRFLKRNNAAMRELMTLSKEELHRGQKLLLCGKSGSRRSMSSTNTTSCRRTMHSGVRCVLQQKAPKHRTDEFPKMHKLEIDHMYSATTCS